MNDLNRFSRTRTSCLFRLKVLMIIIAQVYLCTGDYGIRTKKLGTEPAQVSIVLTPAFASKGWGDDSYTGFIPALLEALKERKAFPQDYKIVPATDNKIGEKKTNGNWTGLIYDVLNGVEKNLFVIGAGPILDTGNYSMYVALSKPWTKVGFTLVVRNSSNITSLEQALQKLNLLTAVKESVELVELRKVIYEKRIAHLEDLLKRMDKDSKSSMPSSVKDGLKAVASEEIDGLLMNSVEARYYVTRDFCNLVAVKTFHYFGNYTFALGRGSLALNSLNDAIKEMIEDGSLEKLKEKELGIYGKCSQAAAHGPGTIAVLLCICVVAILSKFMF